MFNTSYWLSLAFVPLAAGFPVRIFIVQHDCGHLAFCRARRTNDFIGFACSLMTLTPLCVLATAVMGKLHFIHGLVHRDGDRRSTPASRKSPAC